MADEKLNTGPAENTSPEAAGPITTPEQAAASEPRQEHTGPTIPESGDVVVSFDKINELMAEKRQNARVDTGMLYHICQLLNIHLFKVYSDALRKRKKKNQDLN